MNELWTEEFLGTISTTDRYKVKIGEWTIQVDTSEQIREDLSVDFPTGDKADAFLTYVPEQSEEYTASVDPTVPLVQINGPEDYGHVRSILLGLHGWLSESNGKYPFHGSVLSVDGVGTGLIGASGAGKSIYTLLQAFRHDTAIINDDWNYATGTSPVTVSTPDSRVRLDKEVLKEANKYVDKSVPIDDINYQLVDENGVPESLLPPEDLGIKSATSTTLENVIVLQEQEEGDLVKTDAKTAARDILLANPHIPGASLNLVQFANDDLNNRNHQRLTYWTNVCEELNTYRLPVRAQGIDATSEIINQTIR